MQWKQAKAMLNEGKFAASVCVVEESVYLFGGAQLEETKKTIDFNTIEEIKIDSLLHKQIMWNQI